jgi:integrase
MASITQRNDGVWRARYRDAAGKEHARHFALKRDAQRWLNEVAAAVVTGQYVDPKAGKITWSDWTRAWMQRQTWTEGTHEAATVAVSSVPWKGGSVGAVNASHVQAWIAGELKRGLAPSTIKTRLNYVQMAFRAAVADRIIATNPTVGVKPPRARKLEATMRVLGPDEVHAVLEAAGEFRGFVEVCVFAGMRLGEAAGLQLADINFLGRSIRVARQVQGSTIKAA